MNDTQPIRDKQLVADIKNYLYAKRERDGLLFDILVNTGIRIGDALALKRRHVMGPELAIIEHKTDKRKLNVSLKDLRPAIDSYIDDANRNVIDPDAYLFESNKGGPLSRVQAYRILDKAGKEFGVNLSPHALRKTFGYWTYKETRDLATLQMLFNHSSPAVTLRYIGISQDEANTLFETRSHL